MIDLVGVLCCVLIAGVVAWIVSDLSSPRPRL